MSKQERARRRREATRQRRKREAERQRIIETNPELQAELRDQARAFEEKFGRPPGDGDPLIFDPDCDTPTPLSEAKITNMVVEAMGRAGIDAARIYAYKKVGILPTEENMHLIDPADLDAWEEAIASYERAHGQDQSTRRG